MEKLKLLHQACDLFNQGKFDQCQHELEKCCDQDVTPLQWVLKNNHIVSKSYCHHKELQNELKNLLSQVRGIPPSRQVLPVELAITFNYCLLLYKEYQCNVDISTIIDSINSTWLRVCRASNVVVLDPSNQDCLCYFVKAVSCSLSDADLRQPLLLLGCLQSVCHLTCGNMEEADCMLAVISKNMSIMNKTKNVHFRFLHVCSGKVEKEIKTAKGSSCDSYSVHASKILHAVVHSVNRNQLKGITSLMKSIIDPGTSPLNLSAWYWSMFCSYLAEEYSDVINGVSSVINGRYLSVRDRSIATNLLACSLMKQNKMTAAIALLRQCLQDDFSFLLPLYNLSIMYGKQGRVTAKLESLHLLTMALHQENATAVKPEPALVLQTTHGKTKPTIIVQNIIELQPSSLLVFYMLARSCFDAGRFSDAADHYIDMLSALTNSSCVPSIAKTYKMGQKELPSLVTIYFEAALSQTKSGRFLDALLIIKKLQDKLPHPPTYCANPGRSKHPSSLAVEEEVMEEQVGGVDGIFPGRKRQRESDHHSQPEPSDDHANESFYSYVRMSLLKVFCLVKCHQVEGTLQCVNSVLELLNNCQVIHKKEMQHSSKKIKLDQGDIHSTVQNLENQSEHPVLRLKAEAYNNKAIILIGQNKLQDANELLLNSIHCCPVFVDAVYNHTLLLLKLHNQSTASTNWLRFRHPDVTLSSSMLSHLLAKNSSSFKNLRPAPPSLSAGGIPQFNLLMMDKIALEIRLNASKQV